MRCLSDIAVEGSMAETYLVALDHELHPMDLPTRYEPGQLAWPSPARMVVAVALANKMARAIWAMVVKQQDYRTA